MAISRFGLRALLAPGVKLVSGPGCPVCVTSDRDIDRAIALALLPEVILVTFGDMMKVPGPRGNLMEAAARGAMVKVVYSPLEALEVARREPDRKVVFLGVGFETTAPAVAATLLQAKRENLKNFFLLSMHKVLPPALHALVEMEGFQIDGFILPGHVSAIIGSQAYSFLADEFGIPCVIAGFEPSDILNAIYQLKLMQREGAEVRIEYSRVVRPEGNGRALALMNEVFEPAPAEWRGLALIPDSGLALREEYRPFDAGTWEVELVDTVEDKGCRCGEVICGRVRPWDCPHFGRECTPERPVGPCMVSSEGTCASYFLYEYLEGMEVE
jgi:hydrogenase expression/formation protein HypD